MLGSVRLFVLIIAHSGIVGPTGSGKSSLALSFFRFVEADSGAIYVDGIDIAKIGLGDLRSRLTIIPQDPVSTASLSYESRKLMYLQTILSGTIRSTLDPLDEYDDADIFDALRRARLLPAASDPVPAGEDFSYNPFRDLETEVAEQGQV